MFSGLWILCALFLLSRAEQIQWSMTDASPDCPQCRQFSSEGSNFSSILLINGKLVIGAKNAIYYLDFEQESANFFPDKTIPPPGYEACTEDYGQNADDCQNYYKVILKLRNNDLFICGTEAFKPSCSVRSLDDLSYSTYNQDLSGICPASPYAPTSYIKLSDMQNVGFAATAVGVGGEEHAIQRVDLKYGSFGVSCTTKSDNFWLNSPQFVYTFEDTDYVYILFKEIAAEETPERVYSRVARICKTDEGSQNYFFKGNFLTFVKARLYCPYSRDGSAPYTFDSISGAYFLDGTLYVLFTESNSIVETGSVLCSFTMDDLERAFTSDYKNFNNGMWRSRPNPTPFTCTNTRTVFDVQDQGLLMTQSIKATTVLLYSSLKLKTTVASRIQMGNQGAREDFITIYAGSSDGKVLKIGVSTDEYGEIRSTGTRTSDTGSGEIISLINDADVPGAVYAMSQNAVTYLPLDSDCSIYTECSTCQDAYPGCGWCYDSFRETGTCDRTASCNATEKRFFGPFSSCPALPQFEERPQDVTIDLDQDAVFRCTATDESHTKKRWDHLPYGIDIDDSGTLTISSATASDIGCYRCILTGVSGSVTSQACLDIRISPQFTLLPTNNEETVDAGKDVLLTCRATGNPEPTYQWIKIDGELPEGSGKTPEGDLKLIRVINQDQGIYKCIASNNVASISQEIELTVIGSDPTSGPINGGESYDLTIIILAIVVVVAIVIFVGVGVKVFVNRNNNKKILSSQYSTVPEGRAPYPISIQRMGIPGSSLPTHLHQDQLYNHPNWMPQSSTIAIPPRQHNGSPGFPGNLIDYVEQPPPPYQPHLLASQIVPEHMLREQMLPEHSYSQEHEYDEINIMMAQHQHQPFHPDMLTVNGYNSTFRLNNGQMGRTTPPSARPAPPGQCTPPQIPERSNVNYDVMRRDSPHRLTNVSPLANTSPHSHVSTSPWGNSSDI